MSAFVQLAVSEKSMCELDDADPAASRATTTLDRIASALGCPVMAFYGPPSGPLAETDELLRLWSMIEHAQDRARVLAFVRNAVAEGGSQDAVG